MNKLLLTCFLALLCLVGRYFTASSKVADSPGAELLHRSDSPHREGETLPDTFYKSSAGEEFSGLALQSSGPWSVDGGPILWSPVLSGAEASVSRLPSQKGFSLVDDSLSQGQEGSTPSAQVGERVKSDSLSIGDHLPSGIEFNSILNHDGGPIRLDDYQGKYLILQFWAPTCTASIASLPVMDGLQRKFEKDLTILPITVFSNDRISTSLKNNAALESLKLPFVTNAQRMRSYFPHTVIPHVVIIDPEGKIIAITGIEDVTEKNIDQLLADGKSLFRKKSDTRITLPANERLIAEAPQVKNKNLWFQSALTGYIPEVNGSLNQQFKEMSHIRIINMPLLYHYSLAFSEQNKEDYYGFNRIDTIGFDPEEIWSDKVGRDYEDWMAEGTHVFGYELIAPLHANPYQLMQDDLKRFLPHIEVSIERKTKMVYALVQQEGKTYPPSTGGERSYKASSGVQMSNYPLQGFVHHLNVVFQRNSPDPFINLTGIDYPIDLTLNANLSNVESLRAELRENGLDLIHREEDINVLILRKISEPNYLTP